MAPADPAIASLVLSIAVGGCAALLALREWSENRSRDDVSEADADHFGRQQVRRYLGSALMILIALGIFFGSRIEIRGAARPTRQLFVGVWGAVGLLLMALLALAWSDLMATRDYARRHRRQIADERRALIDAERRLRALSEDGRGGTPDPLDGRSP